MNVILIQVQMVVIACPCAKLCRLRSPLDGLAERLRREMRYGHDFRNQATSSPTATIDPMDFIETRFQRTESSFSPEGTQL